MRITAYKLQRQNSTNDVLPVFKTAKEAQEAVSSRWPDAIILEITRVYEDSDDEAATRWYVTTRFGADHYTGELLWSWDRNYPMFPVFSSAFVRDNWFSFNNKEEAKLFRDSLSRDKLPSQPDPFPGCPLGLIHGTGPNVRA